MSRAKTLTALIHEHADMTREAFLSRTTEPHLYFLSTIDGAAPKGFETIDVKSGIHRVELGQQCVLPLEKSTESNSFTLMITLGRARNNDLVVNDRRMSKFHVYFRKLGNRWTITDANSVNGTVVDGIKVPPERSHPLRSGSSIEFCGAIRAVFLEPKDLWTLIQGPDE